MIGKPERKKFTITNDQIWQLLVWIEMQGGRKEYSAKSNALLEEIVREHEK